MDSNWRWIKVILPLLATAALLVAVSVFSMDVLSSVRAIVGGESLYSKSQRDAVLFLSQYARSHEEADYQNFLQAIAVPLGDRKARVAIDRPDPDYEAARQGFLAALNHQEDIPGVIRLFRIFRNVGFMREVIAIWTEGDVYIQELCVQAGLLHGAISSGHFDDAAIHDSVERIKLISLRLNPLEVELSTRLGDASRKTQDLLLLSTLTIGLALMGIGSVISRSILKKKEGFENALRLSEERLNLATRSKTAELEILQLAFYDPLTHLPNRRLLMDRLEQALLTNARGRHNGALLFIDLDNFKTINDTLGHAQGDLLLQQVALRLAGTVRASDTVARLGGDEFVVMLLDLDDDSRIDAAVQAKTVGEKILASLSQSYQIGSHEHHSTPSIGITLFGQQDTVGELLKRADLAMYQAKAAGRNAMRFFDPEMQAALSTRAALEADLRLALARQELLLHYQPQVDGDAHMTGVEALLRWQHPRHGMVSPADFIPLAEDTGLILPIGLWVLETSCAQLAAWAGRAETVHLTMAVNVSVRQFRHPDFAGQVRSVLAHSGADPRRLKLEITESLMVNDMEETIAKMTALKSEGVSFSLDDFGTGYSSLAYLKRLPLDQLKIDQSFVKDVLTDPSDAAIARTIVALAQSLGLDVIAEGVETEAQRGFLARHGCCNCQGYLFSRPLRIEQLEEFMQEKQTMARENLAV